MCSKVGVDNMLKLEVTDEEAEVGKDKKSDSDSEQEDL
jgi:hypothetical protein